jgi:hypothetical protein
MAAETFAADTWLYTTLTAAPALTGKVHDTQPPAGATPPYVVFQQQAGVDTVTQNSSRILATLVYLVRVIVQGASYGAGKALATAVDAALQRASGSNVDGVIYGCAREGVLKRGYTEDGVSYREVVQTYRLWVQGA